MPSFTLRQIKYFITTVECGSLAKASKVLYIAQPSISTAIKKIEDHFDTQLLIRHHAKGISLTPSGKRFYEEAKKLLKECYEFEQTMLSNSDVVGGILDVGCFETAAPLFLPKLIADFKKKYPLVEINIKDGEEEFLLTGLRNGKFDLVFIYDQNMPHDVTSVAATAPQRPYLLLNQSHPLTPRKSISLYDIYKEPLILLDISPSKDYFISLFTNLGLEPNIAFRSPSIEMVKGMVAQGFGYSVLVTKPYSPYSYDGNLLIDRPISEEVQTSALHIAWMESTQLPRSAKLFIEFCQIQLAEIYTTKDVE